MVAFINIYFCSTAYTAPCASNPCLNNGTCLWDGVSICPRGWFGCFCCGDEYKCSCGQFWTGDHCETRELKGNFLLIFFVDEDVMDFTFLHVAKTFVGVLSSLICNGLKIYVYVFSAYEPPKPCFDYDPCKDITGAVCMYDPDKPYEYECGCGDHYIPDPNGGHLCAPSKLSCHNIPAFFLDVPYPLGYCQWAWGKTGNVLGICSSGNTFSFLSNIFVHGSPVTQQWSCFYDNKNTCVVPDSVTIAWDLCLSLNIFLLKGTRTSWCTQHASWCMQCVTTTKRKNVCVTCDSHSLCLLPHA